MRKKMTAAEIVHQALIWGEESISEMISGTHEGDTHRAELVDLRKQMRAYRRRRYGRPADPFVGTKLVSIFDLLNSDRKS